MPGGASHSYSIVSAPPELSPPAQEISSPASGAVLSPPVSVQLLAVGGEEGGGERGIDVDGGGVGGAGDKSSRAAVVRSLGKVRS